MTEAVPGRPASAPPVSHHGIRAWARRRLVAEFGNWRLLLVRTLTSGLAVVLTVAVLPGLSFAHWNRGQFLVVGVLFGLLNALLKPVLQFLALRFLVVSYGLVLVVINAFLLWLLSALLHGLISATRILPVLLGGLVVGLLGMVLDTIAGATPPILDRPDEPEAAS